MYNSNLVHCSRHFITEAAFKEHIRGKLHKKRLKQLKEEPYTQAEVNKGGWVEEEDYEKGSYSSN